MAVVPISELGRPICIGDRAVVRSDLDEYEDYSMLNGYSLGVASDMMRFCGQEVTIVSVRDTGYKISDDGTRWNWVDEMLDGIIVADEDFGEIDMPDGVTLDFLLGG